MKRIVFSDLDGTLLNHNDYSYENAKEMLEFLQNSNIPLIFTTSKTRFEIEKLQKELNITSPFIVENGAAIFFPPQYDDFSINTDKRIEKYRVVILGIEHEKIKTFLNRVKYEFDILSFDDMSVKEVIKYTGLSYHKAIQAKKREFSEPFLLQNKNSIDSLISLAKKYGIKIVQGGRFYHFIGENQDKGKAVIKTIQIFQNNYKTKIESIGLGDSYNDISMLQNVDIPILIPSFEESYIDTKIDNIIKAKYSGSKGWNDSLKRIFLS